MLLNLFTLASLAATLQLAFASPTSLVRRTNPNEPPPVVDLGYARYQGYLNETAGLYWWRGIRYASAQRFQAPQTPATHKAVRNATEYGPICWPASEGTNTTKGLPPPSNSSSSAPQKQASEDCLFLNVVAPAGSCEGDNLPVLVYIHGGGYAFGDASTGSDFAAFTKHTGTKMVVVNLQYRLGSFGFLAGQAMKDYGVTNAGLLDQQFALQWVQQHVSKFGGNPDHVTIWGESAGAGSVMNQIIANGGNTVKALGLKKPLFHAAIGSSVFLPYQAKYNSPFAELLYSQLVSATNCTKAASSFACLEAVDAAALAAAGVKNSAAFPFGFWSYVPVVDGTFLTERASLLLAKGKKNLNGNLFTGINNLDEGFIFTDATIQNDTISDQSQRVSQFDRLLAGLFPYITSEERQAVAKQYPISDAPSKGNTFSRISAVIADSTFVCPTYWTAEAFGSSAHKGLFDYAPAHHATDNSYYIGSIWNGKKSVSSVQSFDGALGGFIETFNPNNNAANKTINPYWPTFDSGKQLLFNTTTRDTLSPADPRIVETSSLTDFGTSQKTKCDFWRGSISVNAGL
ncbi:cephalosporin esterase precursor [Rhodotorula toruloides]|uniref:Carboxylic ester hydrolase n=1 Tax=Rhodotorula toruloides TaxID=5286 RepID=A0A2S9ZWI8_RHOTO|nr:cephalosporin esterase precursor [Rhodotorula toruloides]